MTNGYLSETGRAAPQVTVAPPPDKPPLQFLESPGLAFIQSVHAPLHERNPDQDRNHTILLQRFANRLEAQPSFSEGRLGLPAEQRPRLRESFAEDTTRCEARIFGAPVLVPALEAALTDNRPVAPEPDRAETERLQDLSLVWLEMFGHMRRQMAKAARQGKPGQNRSRGR